MPASQSPATVYAWLLGQDDNIGDTVLRREYANALRARGTIITYVGAASDGYISGLGLHPDDHARARFVPWLREIRRAAKRGRVTVAINSGEFALSRLYALMGLGLLPVLRSVRRNGGTVVWLGAAVPWKGRKWLDWIFRGLFTGSDMVRWRDSASSRVFRAAPWMPDWAFASPTVPAEGPRTTLGVSLRFDRPYPSPAWLAAVRELAERLHLDVVAVAQVQRDNDYARRLALDLDGTALAFETASHADQERAVRHAYSSMRLMLSDRLHGLIIAATEGVVPLAWCEAATEKIDRHLDPVGLTFSTVPQQAILTALHDLDDEVVAQYAKVTRQSIEAAAEAIAVVRAEVIQLR